MEKFSSKLFDLYSLKFTSNLFWRHTKHLFALGMCPQWPSKCGPNDGILGDGGFSDGVSLALSIGNYQTVDSGPLQNTLKIVVTLTLLEGHNDVKFLSYFNTTFNQGIEPGEFLWQRSFQDLNTFEPNPIRSPQIFEDSLDQESFDAIKTFVPGINVTCAKISATTIDNPAFGVVAGQSVEILAINIFGPIPTVILGGGAVDRFKESLAQSAREIAGSSELLAAIQDFVSGESMTIE